MANYLKSKMNILRGQKWMQELCAARRVLERANNQAMWHIEKESRRSA